MITKNCIGRKHNLPDFGRGFIAGVDEAGCGSLAGPVVAAAVILTTEDSFAAVCDSKCLGHAQRLVIADLIKARSQDWAVGQASVQEIDMLNILRASLLAMRRALQRLKNVPDIALIDGRHVPDLPCRAVAVIGGDARIKAIGAASILAKVTRDHIMSDLHEKYPLYRFSKHKGYPTRQHIQALCDYGICPAHRKSYRPVKQRCMSG